MGKLLLFAFIGVLIYLAFRNVRRPETRQQTEAAAGPEAMIECAHCRLHVPISESVSDGNRRYCSEEHRRLGCESR